jgi:hypothetical protein
MKEEKNRFYTVEAIQCDHIGNVINLHALKFL